jgi:formylmethanofuran dehydrogenase subunit E
MSPKLSPLVWAFLNGAKWWEYVSTGATMWQSDQNRAMQEALRHEAEGTLGMSPLQAVEFRRAAFDAEKEPRCKRCGKPIIGERLSCRCGDILCQACLMKHAGLCQDCEK